ncbi:TetR/AcrR family transcriptional regulator C-terminal domain-containing protein [Spiractinospora alimapuensis]|uniref:TetR/AcrR family transcriptional regulator n=1 Tax=Spiractinospora alimapuensis TaxID=2820884 RepID=UPI001F3B51BC|nr:TetR/AcrR family transcriptional regulator [Spiractinospora alimapuensis]QVQ52966.1 TetR/AcrR family transcriptional regulator C-terminal domain-containing protein [Spiractinospora alimapuensis]
MSRNSAGLSRQRIVEEALRIIDGQGLRRLTMRRLGDALEVEAMAVYHHFPLGKEQLFDAIVEYVTDATPRRPAEVDDDEEELVEEPAEEPPPPWDARIGRWAHEYRARLLRHAGALPLLIHRRPDTPAALRSREDHVAAFREAGLSGPAVADAAAALESYVFGAALTQVRSESPHGAAEPETLERLFQRAGDAATDFDSRFLAGLDALILGHTGVRPAHTAAPA